MENFLESVSNFIANTTAKYHSYIERENATFLQQSRAIDFQQARQCFYDKYYATFAELFKTAINNTSEITHIAAVKYLEQLVSANPVGQSKNGFYYAEFRGLHRQGYDMTANSIGRILQSELDTLIGIYGYPKLKLFVRMQADGRIIFRLAFRDDVIKRMKSNL